VAGLVHFCLLPLHGYWVENGSSGWKIQVLDSSSILVSVHAWREPLAPLNLAILLATIFPFNSFTLSE